MCSSYLLSWGSQQCNPHLLHASKDFLAPLPGNERKQQHIIVPRQLTTSKIFWRRCTHQEFLAPLPGRKITSARGVSHSQSFYFVIVFAFLFLFVAFYQKSRKNSLLYIVVICVTWFIFVKWLLLKIPSCVTLLAPTIMILFAHPLLHLLLKRPFMILSLLN